MNNSKVLLVAVIAVALSGCATKRYGRLQPLTGAETNFYSCREIDMEMAKVEAFRQQVSDGAPAPARPAPATGPTTQAIAPGVVCTTCRR